MVRLPPLQARVRRLRRIADDHDGKVRVGRVAPDDVEQRLAHVEGGAIEDERVGAFLGDSLANRDGVPGRGDVVPAVAEREAQQLGDLGRVVDEENAAPCVHVVPGPAAGSRSNTHTRPPAV